MYVCVYIYIYIYIYVYMYIHTTSSARCRRPTCVVALSDGGVLSQNVNVI